MTITELEAPPPGLPSTSIDVTPDGIPALSDRRRTFVLAAMCLALVLVVAGVTMLTNALPNISSDLELSQTEQTWVVDAYALPFAAFLLIAGALGDRYGRRGALIGGTVLFGLGALLSANASGSGELFAYRALMGIGAALIMPGTLSTITSVFPAEKRARAVGVWTGFAMGGGTLGLLGSGLLLRWFWWGSIFLVATAIAAVTLVAIVLAVPTTRAGEHVGLDPGGTVLSALAVGGIVFGIIEGPEKGWTSAITIAGLAIGLVAAVGFVLWELRVRNPLLDPRLFSLPGFGTGAASIFVMFMAMFGFFLVSIQFLQLILGYTPLAASIGLLPQMLVMMPLAAFAAQLSIRVGQRRLTALGLLIGAIGMLWFVTIGPDSSYLQFLVGMLIVSVGIGLGMTPATMAIVSSLPASKQGVASAMNDTAREVGAAVGVAVLGSAFNSAYRNNITPKLDGYSAEVAESAREAPASAFNRADELGTAGRALRSATEGAFESGLHTAVLVSAGLMLLGALYTWWRGADAAPSATADLDDEFAEALADGELEAQLAGATPLTPGLVFRRGRPNPRTARRRGGRAGERPCAVLGVQGRRGDQDRVGPLFAGCNVENVSFPEGICAEASAIGAMVSAGEKEIVEVLTVANGDQLTTCCGGCRQRLREFAGALTPVHAAGPEGIRRTFTLGELLPESFGPEHLVP